MVDTNESSGNNLKRFGLAQTCKTASIVSCQPVDTLDSSLSIRVVVGSTARRMLCNGIVHCNRMRNWPRCFLAIPQQPCIRISKLEIIAHTVQQNGLLTPDFAVDRGQSGHVPELRQLAVLRRGRSRMMFVARASIHFPSQLFSLFFRLGSRQASLLLVLLHHRILSFPPFDTQS